MFIQSDCGYLEQCSLFNSNPHLSKIAIKFKDNLKTIKNGW